MILMMSIVFGALIMFTRRLFTPLARACHMHVSVSGSCSSCVVVVDGGGGGGHTASKRARGVGQDVEIDYMTIK